MQEEHQSELALSGWYLTGAEGVLQPSDTEAYLWARKAAQAGLAKAEYAMGYFTEVGIVGPASMEEAKRWYWRSACELYFLSPSSLHPSLLFSLVYLLYLLAHRSTDRNTTAQNFGKARERLEELRKGGPKMHKSRVSRSAIRKSTEGECNVM